MPYCLRTPLGAAHGAVDMRTPYLLVTHLLFALCEQYMYNTSHQLGVAKHGVHTRLFLRQLIKISVSLNSLVS